MKKIINPIIYYYLQKNLKKGNSHLNIYKNNLSRIKLNRLRQSILCNAPTYGSKKIRVHRKKTYIKKNFISLKKQITLGIKYFLYSLNQERYVYNLKNLFYKLNFYLNRKDTPKVIYYYKFKDIYIKNKKLFI